MFSRKKYQISLGNVYDDIEVVRGSEILPLTVDESPANLVRGLSDVHAKIQGMDKNTPVEDWKQAAQQMATVIFGTEQAQKLMDFYRADPFSVISVCTNYFADRLRKKITDAQKKK